MRQGWAKPQVQATQDGLTLVELLVAMALSLLVGTFLLQTFSATNRSYEAQEYLGEIQENGRFAVRFFNQAVRHADFWGCVGGREQVTAHSLSGFSGKVVTGTDKAIQFPPKSDTVNFQSGTDGTALTLSKDMGSATSDLEMATVPDVSAGDPLLVENCNVGDLFQADSVTNKKIAHSGLSMAYESGTRIFKAQDTSFQIDRSGDFPQLERIKNGNIQPLVPGVEDLQIEYGVDDLQEQPRDREHEDHLQEVVGVHVGGVCVWSVHVGGVCVWLVHVGTVRVWSVHTESDGRDEQKAHRGRRRRTPSSCLARSGGSKPRRAERTP